MLEAVRSSAALVLQTFRFLIQKRRENSSRSSSSRWRDDPVAGRDQVGDHALFEGVHLPPRPSDPVGHATECALGLGRPDDGHDQPLVLLGRLGDHGPGGRRQAVATFIERALRVAGPSPEP